MSTNSSQKDSDAPPGSIASFMEGRSPLAREYHAFLQSLDPLYHWREIRPLQNPLRSEKTYSDLAARTETVSKVYPALVPAFEDIEKWGHMAQALGFRYAWSRLQLHSMLLDVLNDMVRRKPPRLVIEPGCFCGGLAHFLPAAWGCTYWGSDVSPVALDVLRKLEKDHALGGRRLLTRMNFLEATVQEADQFLEQQRAPPVKGALLVFSNMASGLHDYFRVFPCLNQDGSWLAISLFLSYWANAGATVVLCGGHPNPEAIATTVSRHGFWQRPVSVSLKADFPIFLTADMAPNNPLGDWEEHRGYVIAIERQ